jgi:hypothetical protein
MWAAVETYYKHGEHKLTILYNESSLRNYINNLIEEYNVKIEDSDDEPDILYLISFIEEIGNYRVENQEGWGVKEIRKI